MLFVTFAEETTNELPNSREKRGRKLNYRQLARGLHMIRLGKRGGNSSPLDALEDRMDKRAKFYESEADQMDRRAKFCESKADQMDKRDAGGGDIVCLHLKRAKLFKNADQMDKRAKFYKSDADQKDKRDAGKSGGDVVCLHLKRAKLFKADRKGTKFVKSDAVSEAEMYRKIQDFYGKQQNQG